jgi:hypothetical protein
MSVESYQEGLFKKIQTQETGRPFVPVPFRVFLRGRFCKFFAFNRTSKIGESEGVNDIFFLPNLFFFSLAARDWWGWGGGGGFLRGVLRFRHSQGVKGGRNYRI